MRDAALAKFQQSGFDLWASGVDKATISLSYIADAWPVSRSLILRGFSVDPAALQLNTDKRSLKVAALVQSPNACLLIWDRDKGLQSQLWGTARVISEQADPLWLAAWARVKPHSMEAYARPVPPGTPLSSEADRNEQGLPDRQTFALPKGDLEPLAKENFAVLRISLQKMELVDLRPGDHRRAVFDLVGKTGHWICP